MKIIKVLISFTFILLTLSVAFYLSIDADKLKKEYTSFNKAKNQYEILKKKPAHWISIKDISKEALWAIIVSEDWAFYDHAGVDLRQIKEAISDAVTNGDKVRGASTISQQVVKNALYSNKRSFIRKFKELIGTLKLENNLTKDQILEQYINLIELGESIYGIKEASNFYFDKHPRELTAKEGAFLAMLLPSPIKYSFSYRDKNLSDYAKETIDRILIKLRQAKIITEDQRLHEQESYLSFEEKSLLESFF